MRILLLIHSPQRRGAEVAAADLAAELHRRGHAASTLALYRRHDGAAALEVTEALDARSDSLFERAPGFQPGLLRMLLERVEALAPDVILASGGRVAKYGALLRRRRPAAAWKLVYRNIGDPAAWSGGAARRLLFRTLVLSRMDGIVTLSEAAEGELTRLFQPSAPVAVIPNSVDISRLKRSRPRLEVRAELGVDARDPVAVMVGSLSREKRVDRALRVFESARREVPGLALWVVGDGPQRGALETRVRAAGLEDRVRLVGATGDVASYLGAADLLLLTSDTEGVPGVVLEAGALGLPAVATRVGGVPECVEDGQTGILADAGDEAALAEALVSLARDLNLRGRLGEAARARVDTRFAVAAVAVEYERFFAEMTGGR